MEAPTKRHLGSKRALDENRVELQLEVNLYK